MKIQEKMRKPMMEAKYLNVENTEKISPDHPAFLFKIRKTEILAVSGGGIRRAERGSFFCRIYNDTVSAGSGGFGIMGKPGNNSGYQKGQQY